MIVSENIIYDDQEVALHGTYFFDNAQSTPRPVVLVAHDWSGKNEFALNKARALAELGYVGFAIDMYGQGRIGKSKEEKTALIQPFMQDRLMLRARILSALHSALQLKMVDPARVAAIGFCFGGLCVLDLARSGTPIQGVVSFHGLLQSISAHPEHHILAKILVLHGYDDPMATPAQVIAFANEMTNAQANWQINMYSQTMHAFSNPEANDPQFGTVYQPQTNHRAWLAMTNFFEEIF